VSPRSLRLLIWADYLAPAVLSRFESETGIHVEGVWFRSEDEAVARVTAGEPFDVVVASDYIAERYRSAGVLQPLDMDRLPAFSGVTDARLRRPPHDPETNGHKYTSVLYFGTEGLAVRIDEVARAHSSWEALFDREFAGRIAMLDGAREVLSTALYLLGASPNTTDRDVLERATDMLVEQRRLVTTYDSDTPWRHIVDGVAVVHCYDGDVARAISAGSRRGATYGRRKASRSGSTVPASPFPRPIPTPLTASSTSCSIRRWRRPTRTSAAITRW
jgi:spermidine/putrescine-binding protein